MVLPEGMVVPDAPYVVGLVLGALLTTLLLWGLKPPVTKKHVFAFFPWIATGGIAHAFYQVDIPDLVTSPPGLYPEGVAPLFSAPSVYLTMYVAVGVVWLAFLFLGAIAGMIDRIHLHLGVSGMGVLIVFLVALVWQGLAIGLSPLWPIVGFVASFALTAIAYFTFSLQWTDTVARTGLAGSAVVFAHVFDGVTTAIGMDVIGITERSPLPRVIMDVAAALPTAEYIGVGWLFVVVKLVVVLALLWLIADLMEERPTEGSLLLIMIAAFGLGPAANNFVLFALG